MMFASLNSSALMWLTKRIIFGAFLLCAASCSKHGENAISAPPTTTLTEKIAHLETKLTPPSRLWNQSPARETLVERMRHHNVPGVSIAIIEDNEVVWAKGYGKRRAGSDETVDTETVFSVGSLSKVAAAMVALRMVDAGLLDLDEDVNTYLEKWRVPYTPVAEGEHVTLRRLMSHTAGLNVHGFADFGPAEKNPTTVEILNGSGPAKNEPIIINTKPGSSYSYSGGGTTVTQLIVEDTTGQDFTAAAHAYVFEPLGMSRSTFENPLPSEIGNIASAHGPDGTLSAEPRGWHSFPETAASGLWTTPSEYARMLIALVESYLNEDGSFLSHALAQDALTQVPPSKFGLGPGVSGAGNSLQISHTGSNEAYKARFDYYPNRGEGIVIVTNGANGSKLRKEIRSAAAEVFGWND